MATNTTNFNLKKPGYSDTADIADINGNMDKVDVSLNGLADAIAIVSNNNTHAAITTGQYVYVHGHSSLAEGLYTAKSNIAANATLSTSNLQADGSGGLNALNSGISNLNTLISGTTMGAFESRNAAAEAVWDSMENGAIKIGRLGVTGAANFLFIAFKSSSNYSVIYFISYNRIQRYIVKSNGTNTEYTLSSNYQHGKAKPSANLAPGVQQEISITYSPPYTSESFPVCSPRYYGTAGDIDWLIRSSDKDGFVIRVINRTNASINKDDIYFIWSATGD